MSCETLACQVEWVLPEIEFGVVLVEIIEEIDEVAGCFT